MHRVSTFNPAQALKFKIQNHLSHPPGIFLPSLVGRDRGRGKIQDSMIQRFKDSKIQEKIQI
jgi:hypothetical protein